MWGTSSREGLAALEQPPLCLAVGQRVLPSFRPCVFPPFRLVVVAFFSQLVAHAIGRAALRWRAAFLSIVEAQPRSPSSSNATTLTSTETPLDGTATLARVGVPSSKGRGASLPPQISNTIEDVNASSEEIVNAARSEEVQRGEIKGVQRIRRARGEGETARGVCWRLQACPNGSTAHP